MGSIENFYAGKSVFITGATGFMGKVLIEKLLRSCPDIGSIYILVRSKKDKSPQQRWNQLTKLELFDRLKKEHPRNLEKVKVLDGQLHLPGFGLEKEIYEELRKNVTIIFHAAASVRFDEPLQDAYRSNVSSTINVLNFAIDAKKIEVFLHVSTSYANSHETYIEERIYPPLQDWRELGKTVAAIDSNSLDFLTQHYINPAINTYTFTKHLAEQVVNEYKERIPIAILRPSIVTSTINEPMAGWVDNLNGPYGSGVLASKGILRCIPAGKEVNADFIPVDISVKSMIVAAWKKGVENPNGKKYKIDIYNSSSVFKSTSYYQIIKMLMHSVRENSLTKVLWNPSIRFTSKRSYAIHSFFLHVLPGYFIDSILTLTRQEPRLIKLYIKVAKAFDALDPFLNNEWKFETKNFIDLIKEIPDESKKNFDYSFENANPEAYALICFKGIQKHILRENDSEESVKSHNRMMEILDFSVKSIALLGIGYTAFASILF